MNGELAILFVCTANQCRSPLAEVIAADQLGRRGVAANVGSAGFLAGGVEAAEGSVRAAAKMGLDLTAHRSRRLDAQMIDRADVIITMEPQHVLDLVDMAPGARDRTMTLKELVRHASTGSDPVIGGGPVIGGSPVSPGGSDAIRRWVGFASRRGLDALLRGDTAIADPMGRSNRAFRATAREIDALLTELFDAWIGPGTQ